jgi:hypothetical protein
MFITDFFFINFIFQLIDNKLEVSEHNISELLFQNFHLTTMIEISKKIFDIFSQFDNSKILNDDDNDDDQDKDILSIPSDKYILHDTIDKSLMVIRKLSNKNII